MDQKWPTLVAGTPNGEGHAGDVILQGALRNTGAADERYARGVDVSVEPDTEAGLAVKLQTDDWEVNIRASADDLLRLSDIRSADWGDRRSIQVGESAGAPVFWAITNDYASAMIGLARRIDRLGRRSPGRHARVSRSQRG
jgi:hypothetical protein